MAIFEAVSHERRDMGWAEREDLPWVIGPPRNAEEKARLFQTCLDADVMVFGAGPREVLQARVATGKLSLVSAERLLKKPFHHLRMFNPRYATGIRRYRELVNQPHVHALTIGHYAPDDLRTIGVFDDRIWKWGYFIDMPATLPLPPPERPLKLLWVGRMLKSKRIDTLLYAIARIHQSSCFGECVVVGDGPEKERLQRLARRLRIDPERLRFVPSVAFDQVRRLMRESDIYVLPSNRHEGWGAVAGEAMSEGCVLVANEKAGAAKELIIENETGLLFRDGDVEHLASQLKRLALNFPLRMQMRQQAWEQMQTVWHSRIAAERLIALCNGLLGNCEIPSFANGPCCKAGASEHEGKN